MGTLRPIGQRRPARLSCSPPPPLRPGCGVFTCANHCAARPSDSPSSPKEPRMPTLAAVIFLPDLSRLLRLGIKSSFLLSARDGDGSIWPLALPFGRLLAALGGRIQSINVVHFYGSLDCAAGNRLAGAAWRSAGRSGVNQSKRTERHGARRLLLAACKYNWGSVSRLAGRRRANSCNAPSVSRRCAQTMA